MKTKIFTMLLLMAFFGTYTFAQCVPVGVPQAGQICTYDTDGTFVVPAGYIVNITVQAWGGGGGGLRGGGGGGAYATNTYSNIPAGSYSITVGQQVAQATAGNPSSYTFLAGEVIAGGGAAGKVAGGTQAPSSGGVLSGSFGTGSKAGGTGGSTSQNGGGGGGGAGPSSTNGITGDSNGSPGGMPNGGAGSSNNSPGIGGSVPGGGGGGGGAMSNVGGTGAAGRVIVTVISVLPVELISFTGKATPSAIQLNWETSTELNNEKFVIERSTNGRTFSRIGEERGQGTTQQIQSYQFMDQAPVAGINYYRLKQMDYDGQFAYSPVTAITFTRKGGISVYPTATNGMVNIVTEDEGSSLVKVFHINGSLMKQQALESNTLPLDLSSLPNGSYLIVVETSTQTYQERIFKY